MTIFCSALPFSWKDYFVDNYFPIFYHRERRVDKKMTSSITDNPFNVLVRWREIMFAFDWYLFLSRLFLINLFFLSLSLLMMSNCQQWFSGLWYSLYYVFYRWCCVYSCNWELVIFWNIFIHIIIILVGRFICKGKYLANGQNWSQS